MPRRGTYWMAFNEGSVPVSQAGGAVSRLLLPSIRELEVGREYEGYTVTRTILNLFLISETAAQLVIDVGLITLQEDVTIAAIDPPTQPHADWMWNETFVVDDNIAAPHTLIQRDLRSQRRTRGGDSEMYFYVVNRGGTPVSVHRSGRMLVKRA